MYIYTDTRKFHTGITLSELFRFYTTNDYALPLVTQIMVVLSAHDLCRVDMNFPGIL